ncbi:hypothetical protein EDB80DRAFT_880248 [Ilyonectria destructans]|nr:hypothetical protein EDB80DRAFT_880248 [Ilyonectria destructans]
MACQPAQSDIATFIDRVVNSRLEDHVLTVGDQCLIDETKTSLTDGAQGMFLWVVFQVDEICLQSRDKDIRETLRNLPEDLKETFYRVLKRTISRKHDEFIRKTLAWVAVTKQPLTKDQLSDALSVEIG